MRKAFYILLLVVCIKGKAQSYIPLPMDSAWWQVNVYGTWSSGGLCYGGYTFQYQTAGDTLIGSYTYTKILHNGPSSCMCGAGTQKNGFIRQDSMARKVYVIEWGTTNELLLYDFTLQVNDTITSALFQWSYSCPSHVTVSSIDSILLNGVYHRRINFNTSLSNPCYMAGGLTAFIEGVGANTGLLEYSFNFEAGSQLDCAGYRGQTIYPDSTTNCLEMGIAQESLKIFTLFPNPVVTTLSIQYPSMIDKIKITDILGNEVKVELKNTSVDVSNLQNGIYFITLISGKENHTQKFIVNH